MHKITLIVLIFLTIMVATHMLIARTSSDFDEFAKSTIRELGSSSDETALSDAFSSYFSENGIVDPVQFLRSEMKIRHEVDMDNKANTRSTDDIGHKSVVKSVESDEETLGPIKRRIWLNKNYYYNVISFYTLIITVTELRSGKNVIEAKIALTGL